MELKKSKEANLERKTTGFRLIGLVMVCATVGMAFEHTSFNAIETDPIVQKAPTIIECFDTPVEKPPIEEEEIITPPPVVPNEPDIVPDDEIVKEIDFSDLDKDLKSVPIIKAPVIIPEITYDNPDIEPTFPGGAGAMNQWIVNNIDYPELAREMGEQGTVYLSFVVDKKGEINKVSIRRGVSDALDSEAKRVVKKMPNWIPGEKEGKPVSVNFTLPIKFNLR